MKHNTRIKNKNTGYFLVKDKVFNSLRSAEIHCHEHGLDVNNDIQSGCDKVHNQVKSICRSNLLILHDIEEKILKIQDKQFETFNIKNRRVYKESLKRRDLFSDCEREIMQEQIGVINGLALARKAIVDEIETYQQILDRSN